VSINIALLHKRIVQELQKRDVVSISIAPDTIQIHHANREMVFSLGNLHA